MALLRLLFVTGRVIEQLRIYSELLSLALLPRLECELLPPEQRAHTAQSLLAPLAARAGVAVRGY